jgi:hypothetical protein
MLIVISGEQPTAEPSDYSVPNQGRGHAIRRILGSAITWFSVSSAILLLASAMLSVMAVGGTCASGNSAYEIAVECPDNAFLAPVSIVGGLIGIFAGLMLAGGFGVSVVGFGWLALFGGLGSIFLSGFFLAGDTTGLIVGIVFVIMGIVPISGQLIGAPRQTMLGRIRATGEQYFTTKKEFEDLTRINAPKAATLVRPRALDWMLSLGVWLGASALGAWVGSLAF